MKGLCTQLTESLAKIVLGHVFELLTFWTLCFSHLIELLLILKGSYDAILKIIIWCIWCNRICWHALMFKKHIIFQILYIIVVPLCPASLNHVVFYKAPPSNKCCLLWLANWHFTFMHLADAFIQSDLQCIQAIHFLSVCVFLGNWTHDLLRR